MSVQTAQSAYDTGAPGYLSVTVWCMMAVYLLIDTASGALLPQTGGVAPMSQSWKIIILALILAWCSLRSTTLTYSILALIAAILIGPAVRLLVWGRTELLLQDATAAIKALLPALALVFCCAQRLFEPLVYRAWIHRVLWFGVATLLLNICLGLLGFGYTAYGFAESGGIGVTGFFYAGNEVGATYVVLCAFALLQTWERAPKLYVPVAAVAVVAAFLIATKSAILGALVLAFGVPFASTRGRVYRLGWVGMTLFALAGALLVWATVEVWTILELSGLADRIAFVYAERGWIGLIFSGRDQFVAQSVRSLWEHGSPAQILFGVGQTGVALWSGKQSTETDPLDLYFWFGVPGIVYCAVLYFSFLFIPMRACGERANRTAPVLLLTNSLLILLSIVGGHVVLSGMVGIVWAALTSLALGETKSVQAAFIGRPAHPARH